MATYQVIYPVRIPERGIVREGTVELPPARARRALEVGSLRRAAEDDAPPPPPGNLDARIAAVIAELDPSDESHFTRGGKPDAGVISERLGERVSAADRDRVWQSMQQD